MIREQNAKEMGVQEERNLEFCWCFHYLPVDCWDQVSFDYSPHIPGSGKFEMETFFYIFYTSGRLGI